MQGLVQYKITGPDLAKQFYFMDALTGQISIKKLLTQGGLLANTVSSALD